MVDYLGRVENMEEVEEKLSNILNRKISIGNKNKSKRSTNYKKYYTKELQKVVKKIYRKDIEKFGYNF